MNKQEAIEKIEKGKSNFNAWEDLIRNRAFEDALTIVKKIDEPERPVVPQFVADWYEEHKENFEIYLSELCRNFTFNRERLNDKLANWYEQLENKPIQTLVNMHQFGYEVQKEKLYIARNKTTGEHLYFNNAKKRFESGSLLTSYVKNIKAYHHTQCELEKLNYWGNSLFEFEEVEE